MSKTFALPAVKPTASFKRYPDEAEAHNACGDAIEEISQIVDRYGVRIIATVSASHDDDRPSNRPGICLMSGTDADLRSHLKQLLIADPDLFIEILNTIADGK